MNLISRAFRFAATGLLLTLAACGGGGDDDTGGGGVAQPSGTVVGAAGGSVAGPNRAGVVVPAGALRADTTIAIEQASAGAPALPAGFTAHGPMFAFTPHGTAFAVPVTMTLPFDAASAPAGTTPQFYKTNALNQWEQVANVVFGTDTVVAQVNGFSHATVVIPPLTRDDPERIWEFKSFPADGSADIIVPCVGDGTIRQDGTCRQIGGLVDDVIRFGDADFSVGFERTNESIPLNDGAANGWVLSKPNGVTYAVLVEAPGGRLGSSVPNGSIARLTQFQGYTKNATDATLKFTVSFVEIEAGDFNFANGDKSDTPLGLTGEVLLDVAAYKTPNAFFFHAVGRASVVGDNGFWVPRAVDESNSKNHLWNLGDFEFSTSNIGYPVGSGNATGTCPGTRGNLKLKKSLTYTVDLSSIDVGEEFTLRAFTHGQTLNRRGGGAKDDCQASYVSTFLQDPVQIGGTTLTITGLTPNNRPLPAPPDQVLVSPAACVPGPNPAAGVLQFDAASYVIDEFSGAPPTVTVTRTGGGSGAVTATFTTSDGTALGGTHYKPVNATVFFGDGDVAPRVVNVPIIRNRVDEIDKTVNLALSQPGGCATLGAQASAVLRIRDADPRPLVPSGLDPSFGNGGKADSTERGGAGTAFGGDRSAMALQADGKIVMVGGTFIDFILARFNADGSLDTAFGVGGKVTTDLSSDLRAEEALAVAIQGDGKIVVAGYTGIPHVPPALRLPDTFALARYNTDGSLDTSFGTGGKVSANVNGRAYAVVIQPDGKIVVAGEFSFTSGADSSDFTVARFNTNGSLDLPFGTSGTGQVATDIGSVSNRASNIVLQANGAIVVSGGVAKLINGAPTPEGHTDIVRYNANGSLDNSFGSGGKLTLAGVEVGEGLVRQADGKLVLVGSVTEATVPAKSRFLLKRLNADGSADTSFGNAGTVGTAFTVNGAASAVALQSDGKIVVVGTTVFSSISNFVVARYNVDGSVDASFGNDGNLSIDFFGFADVGENVLVQPDGKIVVSGQATHNAGGYGLARILP